MNYLDKDIEKKFLELEEEIKIKRESFPAGSIEKKFYRKFSSGINKIYHSLWEFENKNKTEIEQ